MGLFEQYVIFLCLFVMALCGCSNKEDINPSYTLKIVKKRIYEGYIVGNQFPIMVMYHIGKR